MTPDFEFWDKYFGGDVKLLKEQMLVSFNKRDVAARHNALIKDAFVQIDRRRDGEGADNNFEEGSNKFFVNWMYPVYRSYYLDMAVEVEAALDKEYFNNRYSLLHPGPVCENSYVVYYRFTFKLADWIIQNINRNILMMKDPSDLSELDDVTQMFDAPAFWEFEITDKYFNDFLEYRKRGITGILTGFKNLIDDECENFLKYLGLDDYIAAHKHRGT